MSKRLQTFLVAAAMLVALPTDAQVAKQAFKKSATTVETATVKLGVKGAQKKWTAQELQTAKQEGEKQALIKQKDNRRKPLAHKSFSPRRVDISEATPVSVPYEADFSTSGDSMEEDFIIINHNEDLSDGEPCTWMWSSSSGAYYVYNTDGTTPADDYLVLPINLEGGKTYDVIVNAASWNYPEEFEVVAGSECTAEAMTTEIIGKTIPENDAADFSGTFTPAADGVYYIAIHAISPADLFILSVYRFSIDVAPDAAAPEAVSDLTVAQVPNELKNVISFTAPKTTISGEEMTENLTINIICNGEVVKTLEGVAPGSEQSYTDEVEAEATYRYQVIAANAAGQGRKSDIVTVKVSMPQDVPYIVKFTDEDVYDRFLVIDNNEDGTTWSYSSYDEAAQYRADWDNNADDYLVSQALSVEAGKNYIVTARIAGNAYDPERFEVVAGTSPTGEGLNISVIEPTDVTSEIFSEYTGSFIAETDGYYYVAVHAISDANTYYLYVSGLSVEQGPEVTAPAAPTLEASAGAEGALNATIQVTAPDKTIEGNTLSAITKLELYRDGELIGEQSDVTPGAVVTFTDEKIEASALYAYQALAYNESGKGEKSEKTTVYVGLDQPLAPEMVEAVDHPTSVDLSWSAVGNVGMNGGYVNPDEVTYKIWDIDLSSFFIFFNDMITSVKGQTSVSFDYNVDEGDQQDYKYFAVRPVNDSTVDEDQADWNAAGVFVGKPYDAVLEGFANEELHYFWETDAYLAVTNYASDEDGVALALLAETPGQKAFVSGKLNIKDAAQPMLVFDALNASGIQTLYVLGSADQVTWNILQTVTLNSENYQSYQIPLSSIKNHERYAQIAFVANYTNAILEEDYGDYFFLDNIRIGNFFDNDLSVSAIAPAATLVAGKKMAIDVIVENTGLQPASNYTVKVQAGETELLNETVSDELAPFAKKEFQTELSTTVFDEAGDVTVTVTVEYAADENTENNTISGTFTIEEPAVGAPENLTAEIEDFADVLLTWSAPEATTEAVTEDFENGPGEFTQIDANGDGYGWDYMYSDELKSHSGYGGMQSYSWTPDGGAVHVDNWLVTPLAILDGTFSFWAAAQDGEWTEEHFAVYVSTTGNQSVDDFTQVSEEFETSGWPQEYSVDLSSYAGQEGYIAIRHYDSYDQFAMVVDDISFTKAPALPVKYNIYVDQALIATVESDVTTYTVAADLLDEGAHTFAVTAVYANGLESKPAVVSFDVITGIQQLEESQPVDVYSVDGKLVRSQAKTLDDLKGVYIINGRGVILK
ncbi:MAG: choice-of-anchor J domain-containing protein [Bacteroidales bacterium]|nr:choice-of-anchor J domain-containing protein [Bacteroidales bacterium]